jgi:hypothetical protein
LRIFLGRQEHSAMKTSIYDEFSDMADDPMHGLHDVQRRSGKIKKHTRTMLSGYDAATQAEIDPWPRLRRMSRKG